MPTKSVLAGRFRGAGGEQFVQRVTADSARDMMGDWISITTEPCLCGRTHAPAIGGLKGRTDELIKIRGLMFFPAVIEDSGAACPRSGDEFKIEIRRVDDMDRIKITARSPVRRSPKEATPRRSSGSRDSSEGFAGDRCRRGFGSVRHLAVHRVQGETAVSTSREDLLMTPRSLDAHRRTRPACRVPSRHRAGAGGRRALAISPAVRVRAVFVPARYRRRIPRSSAVSPSWEGIHSWSIRPSARYSLACRRRRRHRSHAAATMPRAGSAGRPHDRNAAQGDVFDDLCFARIIWPVDPGLYADQPVPLLAGVGYFGYEAGYFIEDMPDLVGRPGHARRSYFMFHDGARPRIATAPSDRFCRSSGARPKIVPASMPNRSRRHAAQRIEAFDAEPPCSAPVDGPDAGSCRRDARRREITFRSARLLRRAGRALQGAHLRRRHFRGLPDASARDRAGRRPLGSVSGIAVHHRRLSHRS